MSIEEIRTAWSKTRRLAELGNDELLELQTFLNELEESNMLEARKNLVAELNRRGLLI